MKVFALPCAGGSSAMYYGITKYNTEELKFVPIELSGRGSRFAEPLYKNFDEAVKDIYDFLCSMIDEVDYALFGYSMGGLLVYELCCMLKINNKKMPRHIFFASINPPHYKSDFQRVGGTLSDEELLDFVIRIGGVPKYLSRDSTFRMMFFPIIKNDFKILFKYMPSEKIHFDIDITVLYGKRDIDVVNSINNWRIYTTTNFEKVQFNGNHFFINQYAEEISKLVKSKLINGIYNESII